jgi:hypothetical protein
VQIASLHAKFEAHNRSLENQVDPEQVARLENEIVKLRTSLEEQRSTIEDKLARLTRAIRVSAVEN